MKKYSFLCLICCIGLSVTLYAQQKTVTLKGTCPFSASQIPSITLTQSKPLLDNEFYIDNKTETIVNENGSFEFTFKLDSDCKFLIRPSMTMTTYQSILISPGDSICFEMEKSDSSQQHRGTYYLKFIGKKAAEYNYSYECETVGKKILQSYGKDSLTYYKQELNAQKEYALHWLTEYSLKHALPQTFVEIQRADIINGSIYQHFIPFRYWQVPFKDIPKEYWDNTSVIENPLSHGSYLALLHKYVLFYTNDLYANFKSTYDHITQNFNGYAREYLLSMLIGRFALHQNENDSNELTNAINKAPDFITTPQYLDYIVKAGEYYQLVNKALPDSVLNNTYLKEMSTNKQISLKEMLAQYTGKAIYIDCWASWCSPCKENILLSGKAKKLLKEREVTSIYLSLDEKEKDWKIASKKLDITENQFCLMNPFGNPLYNFLHLKASGIPRYILLDSEHKVKNARAPRTHPDFFEELEQCLDGLKPVTYY